MKKEIGALLATATIVSGCDQDWSVYIDNNSRSETVIETPSADLPPDVSAQIPNTTALINDVTLADGTRKRNICSGMRVSHNFYLTSGHCDTTASYANEVCQEITLSSPGPRTVEASGKAGRIPIVREGDRSVGSDQEDIMLLQSPKAIDSPDVRVYETPNDIPRGTPLYSINYQPTIDGQLRNPDTEAYTSNGISITTPAIVGMVAVYNLHEETILAMTTSQSYGATHDTAVREGASGSPVFDDKGILVGILNGMSDEVKNIGDFEDVLQQDVSELPDETPVQMVTVKTITPGLIEQLRDEQQPIMQCD